MNQLAAVPIALCKEHKAIDSLIPNLLNVTLKPLSGCIKEKETSRARLGYNLVHTPALNY